MFASIGVNQSAEAPINKPTAETLPVACSNGEGWGEQDEVMQIWGTLLLQKQKRMLKATFILSQKPIMPQMSQQGIQVL